MLIRCPRLNQQLRRFHTHMAAPGMLNPPAFPIHVIQEVIVLSLILEGYRLGTQT